MVRINKKHTSVLLALLAIIAIFWVTFGIDHANTDDSYGLNTLKETISSSLGGGNTGTETKSKDPAWEAKQAKILEQTIMPSMTDAKAKKELGRASWKYFHTLLARFPENPNEEERQKLKTFVQLYAELYPCGECSYHFVKLIEKYPVQTSSREAAAMWGCSVHNMVNTVLKKKQYDCTKILEDYDCGCGPDTKPKT